MIIIDQIADAKLIATLERLRQQSQSARGIYLDLKELPFAAEIKEKVVASAEHHIGSAYSQIYLSEDGDIFVLAPTMNSKDVHAFMLEVAEYVGRPVSANWARPVELPLHTNMLLSLVDAKLEKHRKSQEAKRKLLEQQQAERKRHAILNGSTIASIDDIKSRRENRTAPEFMIIEDDAFSRRLVENVLQKKYRLTGLGEATYAIDDYTRIAPDLLFLDINLPDVSGLELLEKIISIDPDAYVIMLSGNCDKENITRAMSKGAKGFVAKPFTREKLFQYIERCPTITY